MMSFLPQVFSFYHKEIVCIVALCFSVWPWITKRELIKQVSN